MPDILNWVPPDWRGPMALDKSDTTMLRVQDAVAQGKTTWEANDVQAWFPYRDALRPIVAGKAPGPLPPRPPFPANT